MNSATERIVQIPFKPRELQRSVLKAMRAPGRRYGVLVCHRRFGKTVLAVNALQQGALTCEKVRPRFAYIGPTYRQAKATSWDYVQYYARPVPGVAFNQQELRADYPNRGQVRLYGSDNPDSLRGIYLDGAVLDEYGMHPAKTFSEVIGPTLVDRGGWALFCGTPNGKNQFYDIAQHAQAQQAAGNPEWFYAEHKASETGLLDPDYLASARTVMTSDEYAQEFECSFEASVKGAIYAKELEQARTDGRVCTVPYDPVLRVDTDWDLGVGDATAIIFSQSLRSGEVRIIDYYESSGEGLPHYVQVLRDRGYTYGKHWAPHDIAVREFASGRSRLETAAALGIKFEIVPQVPIEDGIHAARMFFPRCWFDAGKTKPMLEALSSYRRDFNTRLNEFKATPVHDWACFTPDTKVWTRHGTCQIMDLPTDGEVLTPCGWKPYQGPKITRQNAPLVAVAFSDGSTVKCTPDHLFLTQESGWRSAARLQPTTVILSCSTASLSFSMGGSTDCGQVSGISRVEARGYTETYGWQPLERCRQDATYTTSTMSQPTTRLQTWSYYLPVNIVTLSTFRRVIKGLAPWPYDELQSGIDLKPADSGTGARRSGRRIGRNGSVSRALARIAAWWSRCWHGQPAIPSGSAQKRAKPLRIVSVTPLDERADTCCIHVPEVEAFVLANGAIVHNSHCADAWRGLAVRHKTPEAKRVAVRERGRNREDAGWMT